jgi:phage/plasmid-associated DNA primase
MNPRRILYICNSKSIVMTTLTIKINESSKKGKAFLEFAKTFFDDEKDVEIIESGSKKTKAETESPYSKAFIAKIKKAEENIKNGETTTLNPDDIWGSLGLK